LQRFCAATRAAAGGAHLLEDARHVVVVRARPFVAELVTATGLDALVREHVRLHAQPLRSSSPRAASTSVAVLPRPLGLPITATTIGRE
jgi:hypothetical protein